MGSCSDSNLLILVIIIITKSHTIYAICSSLISFVYASVCQYESFFIVAMVCKYIERHKKTVSNSFYVQTYWANKANSDSDCVVSSAHISRDSGEYSLTWWLNTTQRLDTRKPTQHSDLPHSSRSGTEMTSVSQPSWRHQQSICPLSVLPSTQ